MNYLIKRGLVSEQVKRTVVYEGSIILITREQRPKSHYCGICLDLYHMLHRNLTLRKYLILRIKTSIVQPIISSIARKCDNNYLPLGVEIAQKVLKKTRDLRRSLSSR